jgi:formylglycine-generating enzyme required for sulfatase activity
MDSTDVTQASYQALMGVNPSDFDTGVSAPRRPVEDVDWYDAALYCNARSKHDGYDTVYSYSSKYAGSGYDTLAGVVIDYTKHGYRLPTEAEWEYACLAGSTADYYWGQSYPPQTTSDTANISAHAWWYYNTPNSTQPVATKPRNAWGLYDMSGNVWQWCNDWYGGYTSGSQTNPTGPASGSSRVLRGGSWSGNYDFYLRSANRDYDYPIVRLYVYGFRCVRR